MRQVVSTGRGGLLPGSVQIRAGGLQLLDTSFVAVLSASAAPLWQKDPGRITPTQTCRLYRCNEMACIRFKQALQWLELVGQEGIRVKLSGCGRANCSKRAGRTVSILAEDGRLP